MPEVFGNIGTNISDFNIENLSSAFKRFVDSGQKEGINSQEALFRLEKYANDTGKPYSDVMKDFWYNVTSGATTNQRAHYINTFKSSLGLTYPTTRIPDPIYPDEVSPAAKPYLKQDIPDVDGSAKNIPIEGQRDGGDPDVESWWQQFLRNNPNIAQALSTMGEHPVATAAGATLIALGMYGAAKLWKQYREKKQLEREELPA